ncbi:MAG: hypothetical protein HYS27_18135 [Deltaproteobacteria bacterium]|nr:hypothetical protein [Deltaproteobacteria bacterium]
MTSFHDEIERRAGGDRDERTRTTHAALCLLAPWLSAYGRSVAARSSGDTTAFEPGDEGVRDHADLIDRVAARAHVSHSRAAEVAGVVAAVLAEGEQQARLLAPDVPRDLADLFFGHPQAPSMPRAAPHAPESHVADERRTLSSAHPGAAHPLATAHPTAQRGSVIEPDPHRDAKLSSGAGTLDRAERTLATGVPKGKVP